MNIYPNITALIKNTPLVELQNIKKHFDLSSRIMAKMEAFNPGGSVKDRIALAMIEDGIKKGLINQDTTIIEATSGNTGIGLAMIGASKGLKVILTMPESASMERRKLLQAYGATLYLTPKELGMKGALAKAAELTSSIKNHFVPSQFENPNNPLVHYLSTGPEIMKATTGQIDCFIAGIGTGGTISGVGKYLKENNPAIKVIGVEPAASPVLTKGISGTHKIQGIGAGFVPKILNQTVIDEIVSVTDEEAIFTARLLGKKEGILAGFSAGAALFAALNQARKKPGQTIVVLFPDTGERYLSTVLYEE
ncbi:MAG: cysteine synthase A [Bacilli bacterium]|jgi:cysteine synthase A|nr:cysteine synthase A [Bacilli bacterium]